MGLLVSGRASQMVLTHLAANPSREFYQKEVADASGVSIATAYRALRGLEKAGMAHARRAGQMRFYSVDLGHPFVREWKVLLSVSALDPLLRVLAPLTRRVILFGSRSLGTDREDSDLDLFVVTLGRDAVLSAIEASPLAGQIQIILKDPVEEAELERANPGFYREVQRGLVLWDAQGEY